MICAQLDSQLSRFAYQNRCNYTRYADDITFSAQVSQFPMPIATLIQGQRGLVAEPGDELRTLIQSNGFAINEQKVRVQTKTKRQEVTGLTVNEYPNVSRIYVRQLRALIHAWKKFGLEKAEEIHHSLYISKHRHPNQPLPKYRKIVEGKINFLKMVKGEDDQIYRKFANEYRVLLGKEPKYVVGETEAIFASLWILESPESHKQGTAFFLKDVGLITCAHVVEADTYAFQHGDTLRTYPVTVVAKNDVVDLAILRIGREVRHSLGGDSLSEILQRDRITLVGFPNYQNGDSPHLTEGHVSGFRMKSGIRRLRIDTPIIAGLSGGPVLKAGKVIGVAVTGADRMEEAHRTEDHGVIPISALDHLTNDRSA
jgi:S1-C subfamily serine protease